MITLMHRIFLTTLAAVLTLPIQAWALTAEDKVAIGLAKNASQTFLDRIELNFVFPLVSLLFAIAFLYFLFGVFEYIKGAANEAARAQGQRYIMFGLIGMFVMLSAVAILNIARGTFGV
jgi:sorbitol-specific phosphotransferase system component IIC